MRIIYQRSDIMKTNYKLLAICLGVPLGVGGISALLTMGSMESFGKLNQPPLSPPGWLFPVVWTVLYLLMGWSLYLVLTSGSSNSVAGQSIALFALQLFFNFFWSIFFFNLGLYFFSFGWLIVMWGLIFAMAITFNKASVPAALLNIPYLLWVAFAGYLNMGIAILN